MEPLANVTLGAKGHRVKVCSWLQELLLMGYKGPGKEAKGQKAEGRAPRGGFRPSWPKAHLQLSEPVGASDPPRLQLSSYGLWGAFVPSLPRTPRNACVGEVQRAPARDYRALAVLAGPWAARLPRLYPGEPPLVWLGLRGLLQAAEAGVRGGRLRGTPTPDPRPFPARLGRQGVHGRVSSATAPSPRNPLRSPVVTGARGPA